jgi:hypothetical protein
MGTFQTLNEFRNYIPNCLICEKEMPLVIEGHYVDKIKSSRSRNYTKFKFIVKSGILQSKHKEHSIKINPESNEMIEGVEIIEQITAHSMYVKRGCPTCDFKIIAWNYFGTFFNGIVEKKKGYFPKILLQSESLNFTIKGGKSISIKREYGVGNSSTSILLDNKYLPNGVPFEFDKIRDFAHLSTRLATIKTFH